MCQFFSLVSNGDGKPLYFDAKLRKKILSKELKYESADSHTSIADYFGFKGEKEDKLNKYEYNPITKVFQIDQKNNPVDDSDKIRSFCERLDFKTIVPELRIHPIIHPFKDRSITSITKPDLVLLGKWASVRDSVWDSVWASVGDSVWDSVGAYYSSFFALKEWKYVKHPKGKNPHQPCIDLWNKGIVPSFDGTKWRLHGKDGKIIWEGTVQELEQRVNKGKGGGR